MRSFINRILALLKRKRILVPVGVTITLNDTPPK